MDEDSKSSSSEGVIYLSSDTASECDDSSSDCFCPSEIEDAKSSGDEMLIDLPHTPLCSPRQASNSEGKVVASIAQVLISRCCSRLCVRDLTAKVAFG